MQSGSRQNAWRIAYRLRCHHLPTRYLAAALKDRRGGWTAGTGVEYAFTDHIIGGLSYNYYEFPTVTLGGGINPATITSRQAVNTVLAKASYKF
jgi:opacity protein-like surface antigen